MKETLFIVAFFVWYFLSLYVSEKAAAGKKIGTEWSFFLSMILSPVIGWIIVRFSPAKSV